MTYFLHFSLFIIYFLSIAPSVGVFNYNYNMYMKIAIEQTSVGLAHARPNYGH